MGSELIPFFTNLFPYYYKKKWVNIIKTTDFGRARHSINIYRFTDDLNEVNDCGKFEKGFSKI